MLSVLNISYQSLKDKSMKKFKKKLRIGVIGGARPDSTSYELALKTGRLIAENGAALVCGGLSGVMEAAAKGAKESGGTTMGILPSHSPPGRLQWKRWENASPIAHRNRSSLMCFSLIGPT